MISRRGFLGGLLATPAIVRAGSLMPLSFWNEELMFRPFYGDLLSMEWITAEFARQVHNKMIRKRAISYAGVGECGDGVTRNQHHTDANISTAEFTMKDRDFAKYRIEPMVNRLVPLLEATGMTKTFAIDLPRERLCKGESGATVRARGVAARGLRIYDINTDSMITRFDILHG